MLRHPYARGLAAFLGSWACLGGSAGLTVVGAAVVRTSPEVALFAFMIGGILSLAGIFQLVNAVTFAAYGTIRSLQRGETGTAAGVRTGLAQRDHILNLRLSHLRSRQNPLESSPRQVRLVMRHPTGKPVKRGIRDGSPERQAKYEAVGYKYLRTEELI